MKTNGLFRSLCAFAGGAALASCTPFDEGHDFGDGAGAPAVAGGEAAAPAAERAGGGEGEPSAEGVHEAGAP
ncbi:MAG TPA: hypothetical protein VFS43_10025 [Polyangiaceae bacterium]|nr:hypothetical protein [Polyangiaceae bacterium]